MEEGLPIPEDLLREVWQYPLGKAITGRRSRVNRLGPRTTINIGCHDGIGFERSYQKGEVAALLAVDLGVGIEALPGKPEGQIGADRSSIAPVKGPSTASPVRTIHLLLVSRSTITNNAPSSS